jgi:polyisoprenoid-binding protein YceI
MHLARLTTVIAIAVASFMGGAARAADKYALDPMHTFVVFKITDLGYAHVVGWFTAVAGQDPADVTKSSLNVTIKTASIDTHFAQRNKDLMSPDFLNVAEFPEMTFKSTSIEKTGDKTGRVTGELTLLGVTKPVTMEVTFNKVAPNPFNNNKPTAGFEAHTVIKRSDFGMKAEIPNIRGRHFDRFAGPQDVARQAWQGLKAGCCSAPA